MSAPSTAAQPPSVLHDPLPEAPRGCRGLSWPSQARGTEANHPRANPRRLSEINQSPHSDKPTIRVRPQAARALTRHANPNAMRLPQNKPGAPLHALPPSTGPVEGFPHPQTESSSRPSSSPTHATPEQLPGLPGACNSSSQTRNSDATRRILGKTQEPLRAGAKQTQAAAIRSLRFGPCEHNCTRSRFFANEPKPLPDPQSGTGSLWFRRACPSLAARRSHARISQTNPGPMNDFPKTNPSGQST